MRDASSVATRPLTVPSGNSDSTAARHHVQEPAQLSSHVPGKSKLKSIATSTAKLFLRGVRESADAFPPLKSVAGGLCYILDNYEVRSPSKARNL